MQMTSIMNPHKKIHCRLSEFCCCIIESFFCVSPPSKLISIDIWRSAGIDYLSPAITAAIPMSSPVPIGVGIVIRYRFAGTHLIIQVFLIKFTLQPRNIRLQI